MKNELKSLTLNGKKYDSFVDQEARKNAGGGASIDVTAQVGQTIVVKEVDANGKPTEWEAVDFPENGSAQSDWNQNDPAAADYVKNRTHWEDEDGTVHKLDKKYLPDTDSFTVNFSDLLDGKPTHAKTINLELFRAVINAYKDWGRMPNVYINGWGSHYAHIIGVTSYDWENTEEEYNAVLFQYFDTTGAMSTLVVYPSQLAYENDLE